MNILHLVFYLTLFATVDQKYKPTTGIRHHVQKIVEKNPRLIKFFQKHRKARVKKKLQRDYLRAIYHILPAKAINKKSQIQQKPNYFNEQYVTLANAARRHLRKDKPKIVRYSFFWDWFDQNNDHETKDLNHPPSSREPSPRNYEDKPKKERKVLDAKIFQNICADIIRQGQEKLKTELPAKRKPKPNVFDVDYLTNTFRDGSTSIDGIKVPVKPGEKEDQEAEGEQRRKLKKEMRRIQNVESETRFLEFTKRSRCQNLQKSYQEDAREQQANYEIAINQNHNRNTFLFLESIRNPLNNLFSTTAKQSRFDKEKALEDILNSSWPSYLPRGSTWERAYRNLKYDLQHLFYDSNGNPSLDKSDKQTKKKAKAILEFLAFAYGNSNQFSNVVHEAINVHKIPRLDYALNEARKPPSRLKATLSLLGQMGTGVMEFAHDIIFGQPNQGGRINNSPINQDLIERRTAFEEGDLLTAFEIADKYWDTPYYEMMIEPLKEIFFLENTAEGIPNIIAKIDPLYQTLPEELKKQLKESLPGMNSKERFEYHTQEELQEIRKEFIERDLFVQDLADKLGVDPKKSSLARELYYDLATQMKGKDTLEDKIELINNLTDRFATDPHTYGFKAADKECYDILFDENGRCKLIPTDRELFEKINFDERIKSSECTDLRKLVNYFSSIDLYIPEAREGIREGLKYCALACKGDEFSEEYKNIAQGIFYQCAKNANDISFLPSNIMDSVKTIPHQSLIKLAGDINYKLINAPEKDIPDIKKGLSILQTAQKLMDKEQNNAAKNLLLSDIFSDIAHRQDFPSYGDLINESPFDRAQQKKRDEVAELFEQEWNRQHEHHRNIDRFVDSLLDNLKKNNLFENPPQPPNDQSPPEPPHSTDNKPHKPENKTDTSCDSKQAKEKEIHESNPNKEQEVGMLMYTLNTGSEIAIGFAKGMIEPLIYPAMHPIEFKDGLLHLANLAYDVTVKQLWALGRYHSPEYEQYPAIRNKAKEYLDQARLYKAHLQDSTHAFIDHIKNKASARERAELTASVVSLVYGPHKYIKYIKKVAPNIPEKINGLTHMYIPAHVAVRLDDLGVIEALEKIKLKKRSFKPYLQNTLGMRLNPATVMQELESIRQRGSSPNRLLKKIGKGLGQFKILGNEKPVESFIKRYIKAGMTETEASKVIHYGYEYAKKNLANITDLKENLNGFAKYIGEENFNKIVNNQEVNFGNYSPEIGNIEILKEGIKKFRNYPNALDNDCPISKAICGGVEGSNQASTARGALYEIYEGLKIESTENGIKKFNARTHKILESLGIKSSELCESFPNFEFDIWTNDNHLIECKNKMWLNNPKLDPNTMNDLLRHKKIADQLNMPYELRSRHKIPEAWKINLKENGIKFLERSCYECNLCC